MKLVSILVGGLGIAFGLLVAGSSSHAQTATRELKLPPAMQDVLWWLPEDTQSLVVATGPFQHGRESAGIPITDFDLVTGLQQTSLLAHAALDQEIRRRLCHRIIDLSVVAGRQPLSSVPEAGYDGALIVVFRNSLGRDTTFIMDSSKKQASHSETLSGVPVVTVHRMVPLDPFEDFWSGIDPKSIGRTDRPVRPGPPLYFAMPTETTLILATNRDFLKTVLARMASRGAARALPTTLPEWDILDPKAKIWAIRHYEHGNIQREFASFSTTPKIAEATDDQAIGLVFWIDPLDRQSVKLRYLSRNRLASDVARQFWAGPDENLGPVIQSAKRGVLNISLSMERRDDRTKTMIYFLLQHAFLALW